MNALARRLPRLAALWLAASLAAAVAVGNVAAAPLELAPERPEARLDRQAEILEHARGAVDLAEARAIAAAGGFAPPAPEQPRRAMTLSAFWLKVDLVNAGARAGTWRLDAGRPYLRRLEVALTRGDGPARMLLNESDARPFDARPDGERILRSAPFSLAPGERATLWIGFAADGTASLPLSLLPEAAVEQARIAEAFALGSFYAVGGALAALALGAFAAIRGRSLGCFALFFLGLLAYNAQLDGVFFARLWPGWPGWNAVASHPIGLLTMIAGLLLARDIADAPRRRPWLNRALLGTAALSAAYIFAPLAAPLVVVKIWAGPLVLLFLALQCWTAAAALRDGRPGAVFYALGAAMLMAYLGFFTVSSQVANLVSDRVRGLVLRWGQLVEGAVFAAAVVASTAGLRRREAEARAEALAEKRRLAALGHDLRQPLMSLRLAAERLEAPIPPGAESAAQEGLRRSAVYLEEVLAAVVAEPGPDPAASASASPRSTDPDPRSDPAARARTFPVTLVLENAAAMFAEEAARRGARLRIAPTSAEVEADPVDLARAVANLVGNAARHGGGRILLGVRRGAGGSRGRPGGRGRTLTVEVRDDGPPLPAETLAGLVDDGARRSGSPGQGLGLGIVRDLCARNGWRLELRGDGPGLVARIAAIPLAAPCAETAGQGGADGGE